MHKNKGNLKSYYVHKNCDNEKYDFFIFISISKFLVNYFKPENKLNNG